MMNKLVNYRIVLDLGTSQFHLNKLFILDGSTNEMIDYLAYYVACDIVAYFYLCLF